MTSAATSAVTPISASDWQIALDAPLQIVTDVEDIRQCLRVILTTPKGSDPLRPDFACDLWRWLDAPIEHAVPHLVRDAWDAISTWEPRIELQKIIPRRGDHEAHVVLLVAWNFKGSKIRYTAEVAV